MLIYLCCSRSNWVYLSMSHRWRWPCHWICHWSDWATWRSLSHWQHLWRQCYWPLPHWHWSHSEQSSVQYISISMYRCSHCDWPILHSRFWTEMPVWPMRSIDSVDRHRAHWHRLSSHLTSNCWAASSGWQTKCLRVIHKPRTRAFLVPFKDVRYVLGKQFWRHTDVSLSSLCVLADTIPCTLHTHTWFRWDAHERFFFWLLSIDLPKSLWLVYGYRYVQQTVSVAVQKWHSTCTREHIQSHTNTRVLQNTTTTRESRPKIRRKSDAPAEFQSNQFLSDDAITYISNSNGSSSSLRATPNRMPSHASVVLMKYPHFSTSLLYNSYGRRQTNSRCCIYCLFFFLI